MYGAVDKFCGMHYEIESRRFKNTPEELIRYGWLGDTSTSLPDDAIENTDPNKPFESFDGDAPF